MGNTEDTTPSLGRLLSFVFHKGFLALILFVASLYLTRWALLTLIPTPALATDHPTPALPKKPPQRASVLDEPRRLLLVGNFPAVRLGMSQDGVELLLGGPPGYYGRGSYRMAQMTLEGMFGPEESLERIWNDESN